MRPLPRRLAVAGFLGLLFVLTGTLPIARAQDPSPSPAATATPAVQPTATAIQLGPEIEQMLDAFDRGENVSVSTDMGNLVGPAELEDLRSLAADLTRRGYPLKVAVISGIPEGFPSLGVFTDELHNYLVLDKGILIVATRTGVSAKSARLDVGETQDLTNQASSVFRNSGYAAGIRALAQSMVDAIQAKQADNAKRALAMFFGMLVLLLLGLVGFLLIRRTRWQRAFALAKEEYQRLRSAAELIEPELEVLPRSPAALEANRAFEPVKRDLEDLSKQVAAVGRAGLVQVVFRTADWELVLKDALAGFQDVRTGLKRTQDLAVKASPTYRPVPLPVPVQPITVAGGVLLTADDLQSRLAPYGGPPTACFFCAQPLQATVAQQVEADLGGEWRQLIVCEAHAAEVSAGQEPLVRSVETEAGFVPWFADPEFVTYRDYDPQYNRGLTLGELDPYLNLVTGAAVVITADDPRWVEFQGGPAVAPADEEFRPEPLPEGADYGPAGYPTDADFSYAAPTIYQPSQAPAEGPLTPAEKEAVESLAPDLRAAFEQAVREAEQGQAPGEAASEGTSADVTDVTRPPEAVPFHPDYGSPAVPTREAGPAEPDGPDAVPQEAPPAGADTWRLPEDPDTTDSSPEAAAPPEDAALVETAESAALDSSPEPAGAVGSSDDIWSVPPEQVEPAAPSEAEAAAVPPEPVWAEPYALDERARVEPGGVEESMPAPSPARVPAGAGPLWEPETGFADPWQVAAGAASFPVEPVAALDPWNPPATAQEPVARAPEPPSPPVVVESESRTAPEPPVAGTSSGTFWPTPAGALAPDEAPPTAAAVGPWEVEPEPDSVAEMPAGDDDPWQRAAAEADAVWAAEPPAQPTQTESTSDDWGQPAEPAAWAAPTDADTGEPTPAPGVWDIPADEAAWAAPGESVDDPMPAEPAVEPAAAGPLPAESERAPAGPVDESDSVWVLPEGGLHLDWSALEDSKPDVILRDSGASETGTGRGTTPRRPPPPPPVVTDPAAMAPPPANPAAEAAQPQREPTPDDAEPESPEGTEPPQFGTTLRPPQRRLGRGLRLSKDEPDQSE